VTTWGAPGSADDKPGSTWKRRRQAWERRRQVWERRTWEHRRQAWEHLEAPATTLGAPATTLGAPTTTLGAPGSAGDKPGCTSNHCRAVLEKQHLLCERCWSAWKSQLLLIVQRFLKLMYSVCILIYVSISVVNRPVRRPGTVGPSEFFPGRTGRRKSVRPVRAYK